IGSIGDDHELSIDETIWARRVGRTCQRHGERPCLDLCFLHAVLRSVFFKATFFVCSAVCDLSARVARRCESSAHSGPGGEAQLGETNAFTICVLSVALD